jgi:hypothetical protein
MQGTNESMNRNAGPAACFDTSSSKTKSNQTKSNQFVMTIATITQMKIEKGTSMAFL